ncbi:hypothetical protein NGRA_0953 [Nosema granulosis]|uniref:Uncharacterized protein n=1 Tax=Nosema granulosis TaxID=83296 RepID=A0A9P6H0C3_9MICR|nr:hypothetical protein NGRA_0953 [Nosema granulosis]
MNLNLVCILYSIGCMCYADYTLSVRGLFKHFCGPEDIDEDQRLKTVSVMRPFLDSKCDLSTTDTGYYSDLKTICSFIDYHALKSLFFNDFKEDYSSVGKLDYHLTKDRNESIYRPIYVSMESDNSNSFSLTTNSNEVLKHLIGQSIINCTKGFCNSLSLRVKLLWFDLDAADDSKFDLEGFNSLRRLFNSARDFFLNEEFDINDPQNAYEVFMNHYLKTISNYEMSSEGKNLPRKEYVKAFKCVRDYLQLSDSLRTQYKSMYTTLRKYDYGFMHKIIVFKTLFIEFSFSTNLYTMCTAIELLNKKKEIVGREDLVEINTRCVFITLDVLVERNIHYVKIVLGNVDILIDVSRYLSLGEKGRLASFK